MHSSSKSGEIALTLTIISLGMMFIGTMFGGVVLQKKPTSNKTQAAGNCFYHAGAYVDKVVDGKRSRLTKSDYQNQSLTITNGLGYSSNMFDTPASPQSGQIEAWYEYPKNGIGSGNFTFGHHPTGYEDGDLTYVTLNLNNKWKVTRTECTSFANPIDGKPDKGCNGNSSKVTNSTRISDFLVTCGVNMQYGWVVEPVSVPGSEPTPAPISTVVPTKQPGIPSPTQGIQTQCIYYAKAQVLKTNQDPLSFVENGGSVNFGVSNDKQSQTIPAGKFGESYLYGVKTSNAVKYAEYKYATTLEHFKPEFQDALYEHGAKPNGANVTLLGLGAGWKITGTFCKSGQGALYGDKGCPDTKDQGRDVAIFKGFKPDCDVNINYGWYVEQAPTPTHYPTSILIKPTIDAPPRFPIIPSNAPTAVPTEMATPTISPTDIPTPLPSGYHGQYITAFCTNKDAYVAGQNALKNTNFGNDKRLYVGGRPGSSNLQIPYRSYIQFDFQNATFLSRKPIIRTVQLTLSDTDESIQSHDQKLKFPIFIKKVLQAWNESTITWNSRPSSDPVGATETVIQGQDATRYNLPSSLIQEWVDNPSSNNGLEILGTEDEKKEYIPIRTFYASEEEVQNPSLHRVTCMRVEYDGGTQQVPVKSASIRRDLNGDEVVNVVDFLLILRKLGTKGTNMAEDFNNDGIINAIDAASVIANFGKK